MNSENDPKVQTEEQTFLFERDTFSVEKANYEIKTGDLESNGTKDESFSKSNMNLEEHATVANNPHFEVTIWRSRKIHINKRLIPLRSAQFLYFASGSICTPFFLLMLSHRGLKLTDFSIIFSMIFPIQLAVSYISGIISDKIGNAKPMLLFLMLGVIASLVALLLSPDIQGNPCIESDENATCFNVFNFTSDLENCSYTCSTNKTYFIFNVEDNDNISTFSNGTHILESKEVFLDTLHSNNTNIFCNEVCLCLQQSIMNCTSTSEVGFKILYCALVLSFYSFYSNSYRFIDVASLVVAKEQNSHFSNERLYGIAGQFAGTLMCNFILNIDKSGTRGYYDSIYWFVFVLFSVAFISALNIREIILPRGVEFTKKTLKLFTDIEIVSVIFIAFVAGTAFTFNNFYHLWFLNSLKASQITIGLHIMTSSVYGLPMCVTSKWWLRKFGKAKIIIVGLLCYSINGISYSFLSSPWLSVVFEVTKAFSYHLYWIAIVIHCNQIAPKGFAATVNAIVGTVHFGIGRSVSVPIGGYFISTYGARTTYRILAGFCLVAAILYSTFVYLRQLFSRKNNEIRNIDPEERKHMRETEA